MNALIRLAACAFILLFVCIQGMPARCAAEDNATEEQVLAIEQNSIQVPLQSVLMLALKNNLDISFASLDPQAAQTDITREEAQFDTLFSSQFTKSRQKKQVGSVLGSSSSPTVSQESHDLDVTLQKQFTLGTQAELKLTHQEYYTDMSFQGLVPQYSGELVLSLTQPLLRDFGVTIGKSKIKIASLNFRISQNQFRKNVMDILYQVESHYWDLYYRIEDLRSKKKSLKRAKDLLREFKIRIEAGTLAPIEIYQAEAEVALRTQDVIVAESNVKDAEDNLKAALNLYNNEKYWNVDIIPTDPPVTDDVKPGLFETVQTALENRPDFTQAKLNLQASNINVTYTKNQRLPRVDLIGSLGTNGLAGRPADTSGAFGAFYRGMKSPWSGHWDDVYDYLGESDYYSYMVGVRIEIPLENRLAKSQHARAKVQASQALTQLKNTENTIINDVRSAIRWINTSDKLIDAASASLRLAREKLKAEEKKYKVGMSTTHDVLEFQEELAKAESNLAFAFSEHSKAIANLHRVTGVLLDEKNLGL